MEELNISSTDEWNEVEGLSPKKEKEVKKLEKFDVLEITKGLFQTPTETLESLIDWLKGERFTILLISLGVISSFSDRLSRVSDSSIGTMEFLLGTLIGGLLFGWLGFALFNVFLNMAAKTLGGDGGYTKNLKAILLGSLPILVTFVLNIIYLMIFGLDFFSTQTKGLGGTDLLYFIIAIYAFIHSLILSTIALSIVNNFSKVKGFFTMVLGILYFVIVIFLAFFIIISMLSGIG